MSGHARLTDPISSEAAVRSIDSNLNLIDAIGQIFRHFHRTEPDVWLTDDDLRSIYERNVGRRIERGTVAKIRLRFQEQNGVLTQTMVPDAQHPGRTKIAHRIQTQHVAMSLFPESEL
jgi:hypothetical protein